MFAAWMVIIGLATAYETDQLTDRHLPLRDITPAANAKANEIVRQSIDETNRRTGCDAPVARTRRVLARRLHHNLASKKPVWSRGLFRAPGYTVYSHWMETDPAVERRSFARPRTDIYSSLAVWHSFVLSTAGTTSTFRLGDVLMGPDKPDHFFDLGWRYWKRSREGSEPLRGIRWGAATENTIYGMFTSKTFSFADLAANHAGFVWFDQLLEVDGDIVRGDDGCLVQRRDFDWRDWVSDDWDEVLNPSVHTRLVQRGLTRHLRRHREAYCASYAQWGDGHAEHLAAKLAERPVYAQGRIPQRSDPYQLDRLCAEGSTP